MIVSVIDTYDGLVKALQTNQYVMVNHVDPVNKTKDGKPITVSVLYAKAWNGKYYQYVGPGPAWTDVKWPFFDGN